MFAFIRHICGERKNTVGHRWSKSLTHSVKEGSCVPCDHHQQRNVFKGQTVLRVINYKHFTTLFYDSKVSVMAPLHAKRVHQ